MWVWVSARIPVTVLLFVLAAFFCCYFLILCTLWRCERPLKTAHKSISRRAVFNRKCNRTESTSRQGHYVRQAVCVQDALSVWDAGCWMQVSASSCLIIRMSSCSINTCLLTSDRWSTIVTVLVQDTVPLCRLQLRCVWKPIIVKPQYRPRKSLRIKIENKKQKCGTPVSSMMSSSSPSSLLSSISSMTSALASATSSSSGRLLVTVLTKGCCRHRREWWDFEQNMDQTEHEKAFLTQILLFIYLFIYIALYSWLYSCPYQLLLVQRAIEIIRLNIFTKKWLTTIKKRVFN